MRELGDHLAVGDEQKRLFRFRAGLSPGKHEVLDPLHDGLADVEIRVIIHEHSLVEGLQQLDSVGIVEGDGERLLQGLDRQTSSGLDSTCSLRAVAADVLDQSH